MEAFLSLKAKLEDKKLKVALDICNREMVENVQDLVALNKAGKLQELFPMLGVRINVEEALIALEIESAHTIPTSRLHGIDEEERGDLKVSSIGSLHHPLES